MKKKRNYILLKVVIIFVFIFSVFASGFLFLDKTIIPKYFGDYDIHGMGDLVGVMSSLYTSPKENELITNGYTNNDFDSGIKKLQNAGYKIENNGNILAENRKNFHGDENVMMTEREIAAICNYLFQNDLLENSMINLKYIDISNISILDFVITPSEDSYDSQTKIFNKSNIKLTLKINTIKMREQIAVQMQTSEALLKIIIPNNLYFTINYIVDLTENNNSLTISSITINGKQERQSKILINLLIDFIFPKDDNMDINKFSEILGNIVIEGVNLFGNFHFVDNVNENTSNGVAYYNI